MVLVPFDVGVVYINSCNSSCNSYSFSPLRCWGGLYQDNKGVAITYKVLFPFDVGVVYINSKNGYATK